MIWVQYVGTPQSQKNERGDSSLFVCLFVCLFANRQGTSSIDSGDSVISICCK